MKRTVYTLKQWATLVAEWPGRVFHRKDEAATWNDGFNYVHPYDPFYQAKGKKKRTSEVKLDEFEISAFHDGTVK